MLIKLTTEVTMFVLCSPRVPDLVPTRQSYKRSRLKVCVPCSCQLFLRQGDLNQLRYVLTDTEELHRKISEMGERIRQLEDALALLQSSISPEKHILLQDELLSIKYGAEKRPSVEPEPDDPLAETVDVFGTLTIGGGGESRYFGASAGSEVCISIIGMKWH